MAKHEVVFRPMAETDLNALYDYVALDAGPKVAAQYVDMLEAACLSLAALPNRGVRRESLGQGVRLLNLERRVSIAYRVRRQQVEIIAIVYGGRQFPDAKS